MDMTAGTESQGTDTTADGWLERVRDAERRGDFLAAYDLGQQALEFFPEDVAPQRRGGISIIHREMHFTLLASPIAARVYLMGYWSTRAVCRTIFEHASRMLL